LLATLHILSRGLNPERVICLGNVNIKMNLNKKKDLFRHLGKEKKLVFFHSHVYFISFKTSEALQAVNKPEFW